MHNENNAFLIMEEKGYKAMTELSRKSRNSAEVEWRQKKKQF